MQPVDGEAHESDHDESNDHRPLPPKQMADRKPFHPRAFRSPAVSYLRARNDVCGTVRYRTVCDAIAVFRI